MTFIYENATQDARQHLRIALRALETALQVYYEEGE